MIFFAVSTISAQGSALPLSETARTPDGQYAVNYPQGWTARMYTSNSVYDWLVIITPPTDQPDFTAVQMSVLIVAPAQLSNAAVYPTTDFESLAQNLLGTTDAGVQTASFDSVRYGDHAAYEALLSDGTNDAFGIAINYGSYLEIVSMMTPLGQRDRWVPTTRAIAQSISIRGITEGAQAAPTAQAVETDARAFPITDSLVRFQYPADWYVLVTPDSELGPYDAWIDLYNGRGALQNLPDAQTGLTTFDSGEFSLRVLVQSVDASTYPTIVDYLNDQIRSLSSVYSKGEVNTETITASDGGSRDIAWAAIGNQARDGSFTVVQLAPGQYALLSASCAFDELANYTESIHLVAGSIALTSGAP